MPEKRRKRSTVGPGPWESETADPRRTFRPLRLWGSENRTRVPLSGSTDGEGDLPGPEWGVGESPVGKRVLPVTRRERSVTSRNRSDSWVTTGPGTRSSTHASTPHRPW